MLIELTRAQAEALYESGWWKTLSAREIVAFQLFTERLCMPFSDFHAAVEETLGHPVFTHQFAHPENLQKEFLGESPPLTFEETLALIPESARTILVVVPS